jgi:hypothetical protein
VSDEDTTQDAADEAAATDEEEAVSRRSRGQRSAAALVHQPGEDEPREQEGDEQASALGRFAEEPRTHGAVVQDNVSEPGQQVTRSSEGDELSRHSPEEAHPAPMPMPESEPEDG